MENTIVAISTSPGLGGIGIVRMSGSEAFNILLKIFKSRNIKTKNDIKANTINYGHIVYENKIIDEVLVSFFKAPHSYTKEDVVEINTHGGVLVMQKILNICKSEGATLASSGEFTKRAFLNGRIDLTQVEAISSILSAKSEAEANISNQLLKGKLLDRIKESKKNILNILMHLEVNIDYPEYETPELTLNEIKETLKNELVKFKELEDTFDIGQKIRDGLKLAIIGKPNSGKSSLLNFLLDKERAIVTDIPGTTRDSIEEMINIKGFPVKIIDTAGIRTTDELVEQIGIEKALEIAKESDLLISIFDISQDFTENDKKILEIAEGKENIFVLNKIDLNPNYDDRNFLDFLEENNFKLDENTKILKISLLNKEGTNSIYEALEDIIKEISINKDNNLIIIHERQKEVLEKTISNLENILENLDFVPLDMLSLQVQETVSLLNELTGEDIKEELLNEIFANFCLGK